MALFNSKKKPLEEKKEDLSFLPEDMYDTEDLDLADIIAPSALKIDSGHIQLGEKLVKTFFVISYPRTLNESWFSPIINLDCVFDISIFIHPIETKEMLKKFQKKVAEVQSQINERAEKGFVRDPKLDAAYQDLEGLRDKLQQAQEKMFSVGVYISVYADSLEELKRVDSEMRSILESRGNTPRLFRNTLVFAAADKNRLQDLDEAVRHYLAWESQAICL